MFLKLTIKSSGKPIIANTDHIDCVLVIEGATRLIFGGAGEEDVLDVAETFEEISVALRTVTPQMMRN